MDVQGNGAGEARQFYNVADFIADLWAGKLGAPARPAERLSLATPVILRNGVLAVVSGHSTASCTSYRISWYDRVHLVVRHKWVERGSFEVTGLAAEAVGDFPPASAA